MADDNSSLAAALAQMQLPNPYLSAQYKGKPLPMPGYEGDPMTAMGTPIQSYQEAQAAQPQGTTLNSLPAAAAAAPAAAAPLPAPDATNDFMISRFITGGRPPPTAAAPAAAATSQAPDASVALRQAYLSALANPQGGKPMPVRGAAVPQAAPLGQPSVLSAFLAAHPSGGQTGSYNNQPFFNTLNQLRGG